MGTPGRLHMPLVAISSAPLLHEAPVPHGFYAFRHHHGRTRLGFASDPAVFLPLSSSSGRVQQHGHSGPSPRAICRISAFFTSARSTWVARTYDFSAHTPLYFILITITGRAGRRSHHHPGHQKQCIYTVPACSAASATLLFFLGSLEGSPH